MGQQGRGLSRQQKKKWDRRAATDVERMPFSLICAMLEDAGYRRHEIKDLSRHYVRHVLQHPRDDRGNPVPPKRKGAGGTPDRFGDMVRVLEDRGFTPHRARVKALQQVQRERQVVAAREARQKAKQEQEVQRRRQLREQKQQEQLAKQQEQAARRQQKKR